jgi:TonB-linked SusC/RagA family outer membrane protein
MERNLLYLIKVVSKNLLYGLILQCLFLSTIIGKELNTPLKPNDKNLNQMVPVKGKVTDSNGNPIPGATIIVEGSTTGTATDIDGNFSLDVPDGAVLLVSFIGFASQRITVGSQSIINIVLEEDLSSLDEVVVVGYGTQRKGDLTGAIDVVKAESLRRSSSSNPLEALQGQVPSAYVTTSGAPGAGVGIVIRGLSTLGNNSPLYIIDGIPTKSGIDNIDASSIENIQVLKDAAASSIYGSRASNGVIIIETKKGERNEITFDSRITTQKYQSITPVLNTEQRGRAMWQAFINEGNNPNDHPLYDFDWDDNNGNPILNSVIPNEWISEELGIRAADTDWWDEVTRPGLILRNELTLSTGGKAGGSRLSLTHYKNKGVFINDDFNKINASLNSHYKFLNDAIEIGQTLVLSSSTRYPDHVRGDALTTQPIIPVYTEDGGWGGPWGAGFEDWPQPVMNSHINSWDNTKTETILGSAYMAIDFTKNLQLRSTLGIESDNSTWTDINRPFDSGFMHRDVGNLTINKINTFNWSLSNTLNYNVLFNNHSFSILAGTELYKNTDKWLNTFADDFASDELNYYQMDAAVGTQTVSGSETGYQLLSFFGKINYNYSDKYLLSATLRHDGSSRFGAENRFGTFPSLSAGWRLDQEDFIKDNLQFINFLKPRYGIGVVGNQEIGNDAALALYEALYGLDYTWVWDSSTSYDINGVDSGTLPSGFRRLKAGNPLLKWETTTENNAGLDFGFLDMKITGSVDYYVRKSKDILIQPPYLGAIGEGGDKWYNGASVENKGWELTLEYQNSSGDLHYSLAANVGHFKDEITFLPEDVVKAYAGNVEQTILGHSQRALFGYVADGLFQNGEEVDAHAEQTGKDIGRIRYADLNSDGVINALDQKFQGNTLPGLIYGLNFNLTYNRWTMNFFLNGEMDKNIYNSTKGNTDFIFSRAGINYGTRVLDAWTPQNTGSTIPALITSNKNNEYRTSSYFIENGSYLKIRNVELNYNFDPNSLKFFNNLRVFIIGENLVMAKSKTFTGPDPENPNNAYGRPLKFTLGVNFGL